MAKIGDTVRRDKIHGWFRKGRRFKGRRVKDEEGTQCPYYRWAPVKLRGRRRSWGLFSDGVMVLTFKDIQDRKGRAYEYDGKLLIKLPSGAIVEIEEVSDAEYQEMLEECGD